MSNPRVFFPLGKAYGKAFCNREKEIHQLLGNINSGKHTLLIAPRRFGKSSLAEKAIEQSHLPATKINFHLCTTEEDVTNLIVNAVTQLIGLAIGKVDKLMVSIKKYLSTLEPLLAVGGEHLQLQLVSKQNINQSLILAEALLLLEKLLHEKNKKVVIFFDEFQEIANISPGGSIATDSEGKSTNLEGAIRTAAQEMQAVSIIFSGSVRSMLLAMFEDENRPLYKLCRKIKLERIAAACYEKHIQKIAVLTWKSKLDDEVFQRMMQLSHRHPYYVNYLCDSVWESCKTLPKLIDIDAAWQQVVTEEWSDALKELASLPMGQRKLLKYLANNNVHSIQSQETAKKLGMATSSIATALHALVEKDYLEQDENRQYQIINPLLLAVLQGAQER